MWWSFLLAAGGIFGLWLVGRNNYWGWVLGLAMQGVWFLFAIATQQWGFVATAVGYGWVNWVNLRKWVRQKYIVQMPSSANVGGAATRADEGR